MSLGLAAQVGLSVVHVKPAGRFGRLFQGTPGIEFRYSPANSRDWLNMMISGSAFRLSPHQDTLQSAYSYNETQDIFEPGIEVYKPILFSTFAIEATSRLYVDQAFTPIAYLALGGYLSLLDVQSNNGVVNDHYSGTEGGLTAGIGVGAEYLLNENFAVRYVFSRQFLLGEQFHLVNYWSNSLGGLYYW